MFNYNFEAKTTTLTLGAFAIRMEGSLSIESRRKVLNTLFDNTKDADDSDSKEMHIATIAAMREEIIEAKQEIDRARVRIKEESSFLEREYRRSPANQVERYNEQSRNTISRCYDTIEEYNTLIERFEGRLRTVNV